MSAKFDEILPYSIDFVVPGFDKSYPRGVFKCLSFLPYDTAEWFYGFIEVLTGAMGNYYLPVLRMADGEYEFLLGYRYHLRSDNEAYATFLLKSIWRRLQRIRWRIKSKNGILVGGTTYVSGAYSQKEMLSLRQKYTNQIRRISHVGIMAPLLTYRSSQFAQRYFSPFIDWVSSNGIKLDSQNYYPFYFVYALLSGPLRYRLLFDKDILVVTSFDDNKRAAIELNLVKEGAKSVQFIKLSPSRSMYDRLVIDDIKTPVDVILVGAGVGAPNILLQLQCLNTLTIDAGYCIECLADPSLKRLRTFCWPDDERNGDYTPI